MYNVRQTSSPETTRTFLVEEHTNIEYVQAWMDVKHISSINIETETIESLANELERITFYDASEYSPILLKPNVFIRAYVLGKEWWFYTADTSSMAVTSLLNFACKKVTLSLRESLDAVREVSLRELKYSRMISLDILEGRTIEYDMKDESLDHVRIPARPYQTRTKQQARVIKEKPRAGITEQKTFYKKEEHDTSLEVDLFSLTQLERKELVTPLCINTSACHKEMTGAYLRLVVSQMLTLQTLLRNIAKVVGRANLSSLFWLARRTLDKVTPLFSDCEIKEGVRQDEPNIRKYKFYAEQQERNLCVCREYLECRSISLTSDEAQCRGFSFLADTNPQLFAKTFLSLDDILRCANTGVLQSSEVEEMIARLDDEAATLNEEDIEELEASDNKLDQDIAQIAKRQIEQLKKDDEQLVAYMKSLSASGNDSTTSG